MMYFRMSDKLFTMNSQSAHKIISDVISLPCIAFLSGFSQEFSSEIRIELLISLLV